MGNKLATTTVMILVWAGLYLVSACAQGDRILSDVDPEAAPLDPSFAMVHSILDKNCVPCHKGGDDDDEFESDDPDLDSCDGILNALGGIVVEALNEETMPPGAWPRLNEREKLIIRRWIASGACAPCNLGGCP